MTYPGGHGPNAAHIESSLLNSKPEAGFYKTIPIPHGAWTLRGAPMAATGANIVGLTTTSVDSQIMSVIRFDDTADASDIITYSAPVPLDYDEDHDEFALVLDAQYLQAGTLNADLTLDAILKAIRPDATTGSAIVSSLLAVQPTPALSTPGLVDKCVYNFSGLGLRAGDFMAIEVKPNEALGTNLFLQIFASAILYRGHVGIGAAYPRSMPATGILVRS